MQQIPSFNNRVIFECTGESTMRLRVVREGMRRAVPEWVQFPPDSDTATLFANLIQFLGRTKSVIFRPEENDPTICELASFWEFANGNSDYRAIWNAFLMLDEQINNEWIKPINAADDIRLKAPADVQPSAPTDEQLEGQGADGLKG